MFLTLVFAAKSKYFPVMAVILSEFRDKKII